MKVIISGSRSFNDYGFVADKLDHYLSKYNSELEIVHGGAKGVDTLAKNYALERGIKHVPFVADWYNLGLRAGPVRNREMAEYGDALIAFYDGKTERSGTLDMINAAKEAGLKIRIVNI
jgi:hypothetical protein